MMHQHFLIIESILLSILFDGASSFISAMNYIPLGPGPTIYQPGVDPIMHLDAITFDDTIFQQSRAFLVEFYSDWCGHCRAFAPYFLEFATSVFPWRDVVTISAIDCANAVNRPYYPRNARSSMDAIPFENTHSIVQLKNQLTRAIRNEYYYFQYNDWPNFTFLDVNSSLILQKQWRTGEYPQQFLVLLFEQFDTVGMQLLLDLFAHRRIVLARRVVQSLPSMQPYLIPNFPYVIVFERSRMDAVYAKPYGFNSAAEVVQTITGGVSMSPMVPFRRVLQNRTPIIQCDREPNRCRELYYASESDILKSMRMAVFDEVTKTNDNIAAENFTALLEFITVLAENFPTYTSLIDAFQQPKRPLLTILRRSDRAKQVFVQLKRFLEMQRSKQVVSSDEWRNQFRNMERLYEFPFPVNTSWQHCAGSSPEFRGYTCGLWTTFHAITVHAYLSSANNITNHLQVLKGIRSWVAHFFGCLECRKHFLHMTTVLIPLNEKRVKRPHDAMLYLWRAHNMANARLHGDYTEDPQFPKRQFPPTFLCGSCHVNQLFNRRHVRSYLTSFYTGIKPHVE